MKNRFTFVHALLITVAAHFSLEGAYAQTITFQKIYQTPVTQSGRDVVVTPDGGYLIAGTTGTSIPGDSDLLILKTNNMGDTLWTKRYGGPQPEYPYNMLPTNDGNYFIIGYTMSYGAGGYDAWLVKIDPSGNLIWTKTYGFAGDDAGKEIIATSDGNYAIVGRSQLGSDYNAWLKKIDPSGNVIWTKYYGGPMYETTHSVKQCADGGFVFVGQTYSYGQGQGDIYLVRTNSSGDTLWTRTYGGPATDDGNWIIVNNDGSYVIVAETNSFGAGDIDVQVLKTDANGNVIWNKFYGGDKKDVSKMIQHTSDGGYIVAAISRSFGWTNPDFWILKLDASGDTTWTRHFGSFDHEHCYAVKQTADGGYIALGHSKSYASYTKIMFLKLDQIGTFGTVSVNEPLAENSLEVFPNPSQGMVKVELGGDFSSGTLRVSNALGQVVYSETINEGESLSRTINLEDREPGIYFLTLQSPRQSTTQKLIVSR